MDLKIIIHIFLLPSTSVAIVFDNYWHDRFNLIEHERGKAAGNSIKLSVKEEMFNNILMKFKRKQLDNAVHNPGEFIPSQHFFKSKRVIENSELFKIIKKLPKGASLHSHDTAMASGEYLFNLTYRENLYGCFKHGKYILHFFKHNNTSDDCEWKLLSDLRAANDSFDSFLKSKLTMEVDKPEITYSHLNAAWRHFLDIFKTTSGLIGYKFIKQEYFYQVLKELYEDNVKYLEFRGTFSTVYDLEGKIYHPVEVVGLFLDTLQKFKENHPDFLGARFIYAPHRNIGNQTIDEYLEIFLKLQKTYPEFIAGFDLVGQEDLGRPLVDFLPQLLKLKEDGVKFFFHAGETNWDGAFSDLNLVDAILLNTTRIGHGYAILKHPAVLNVLKQRKIAIELCPISNQVLKLVNDFRNHPGAILLANDFPVVITSDDPSFWGAKGLSYDWYYTFVGMTNREDDLKFLKQLANNSMEYSVMEAEEKHQAFEQWTIDWNRFIDEMLTEYST